MGKALVVSKNNIENIADVLKNMGIESYAQICSGAEAKRRLNIYDYEIIIINTPLSDESGVELAITVADKYDVGILLLVKSEILDLVQFKVSDCGISVVGKPLQYSEMRQAIRFIVSTRKRYLGLQNENIQLKNKIEEIRIIDRAKLLLIKEMDMAEAEAHRYIEKQAMDKRKTKKDIALGIIKTYEN
jgi:response regulator NasT